jgi:hypothetical protein
LALAAFAASVTIKLVCAQLRSLIEGNGDGALLA